MEDTNTRITVSSVNDVNCFNPERVITIKGEIPDISRAESEVSTKLRAAYESDLAVMTPHSLMFPGLPPAAMMSTAGISSGPGPSNTAFTGHRGAGGHPQGQSPGVGGAVGGPGAFMPGAGPRPGMSPGGQSQETTYLYIPNTAVGAIIGTKGSHIRNIIKFSGSSVKIASQEEEEAAAGGSVATPPAADSEAAPTSVTAAIANQRRVTILGGPEAQWKAQYLIFQKLREEGFSTGGEDIRLTVEILVPSAQVGRIIGKGGTNVREMQRITGAVIKLPEQGTSTGEETSVHIVGSFYSIQSAQRRLRAMVQHPHSLPAASLAGLPLLPNGGSGSEAGPAPQQPLTSP